MLHFGFYLGKMQIFIKSSTKGVAFLHFDSAVQCCAAQIASYIHKECSGPQEAGQCSAKEWQLCCACVAPTVWWLTRTELLPSFSSHESFSQSSSKGHWAEWRMMPGCVVPWARELQADSSNYLCTSADHTCIISNTPRQGSSSTPCPFTLPEAAFSLHLSLKGK